MRDNTSYEEGKPYITAAAEKARREGRIPPDGVIEQRWATVAKAAIDDYDGATFGAKAIKSAFLATPHKVSPIYLRHAIVAYRFVKTGLINSVRLSTFPIAIVDELKRWSAFDLPAATKAAEQFAGDKLSHAAFIKKARQARARHEAAERRRAEQKAAGQTPEEVGAIVPEPAEADLPHRIASAMRRWTREEVLRAFPGSRTFQDAEGLAQSFITARSKDSKSRVAAVLTGPFSDADLELARCREAVLQALGLMMSHEAVVLVCATDRAADYARGRLAAMRLAKGLGVRGQQLQQRLNIWSYEAARSVEEAPAAASADVATEAEAKDIEAAPAPAVDTIAGGVKDLAASARRPRKGRDEARQTRKAARAGAASSAKSQTTPKARTKKRAR